MIQETQSEELDVFAVDSESMATRIDLLPLNIGARELRAFTRATGQPTDVQSLDLEPMTQVQSIEIGEEFITIRYNEHVTHYYNTRAVTRREWRAKYNDDPELVTAIGNVIDLARKRLRTLPDTLACPPGCASCCSGYEPFVSRDDVRRLGEALRLSEREIIDEYVVQRPSADGFILGYLRKVTEDIADRCVFLKGSEGAYYCGVYAARPHDCRAFTPIGCEDVDTAISYDAPQPTGRPFRPRHARSAPKNRRPRS